jgi:hypothetical protein
MVATGGISFGGLRPDRTIASEILKAVEGNATEAALEMAARVAEQQRQRHRVLSLELEQAQYEVRLAARRYEAVDPDNRLVAAELEARWNVALQSAGESNNDHVKTSFLTMPDGYQTKKRYPVWRTIFPPFGTQRLPQP